MAKKNLVFDFQFLQTDAYKRGMGFFARNLTIELLSKYARSYETITFVGTNKLDSSNLDEFVLNLDEMGLSSNISCVYLDLDINEFQAHDLDEKFKNNQLVTDRFAEKLSKKSPVLWFAPSITQEPCITVLPASTSSIKTAVLWHDMIPFLYADHYLKDDKSAFTRSYLKRMLSLYSADAIVTNSETTKNDLLQYLFIDEAKISVIYGSSGQKDSPADKQDIEYRDFILCVTSPEINKNLSNTLKAFAHFNTLQEDKYTLVIPSDFSEEIKNNLAGQLKNVSFTGHVSDAMLSALYSECEFLLYPSKYDGLGMPIIEAAQARKPIVTSDLPIFREFDPRGEALYLCNPDDTGSIVEAMLSVLRKEKSKKRDIVYEAIYEQYNWEAVASKSQDAFTKLMQKKTQTSNKVKRIAIVGPHPASFSSIGKFITEQLSYFLSRAEEVDYYFDSGPSDRAHGFVRTSPYQVYERLYPIRKLTIENARSYDQVVYHMGNSDHHMLTYLLAHAAPGTVILHDTNLAGNGLAPQMKTYGLLSGDRIDFEIEIEKQYLKKEPRFIASLISTQKKVVVHSNDAADIVRAYSIGNPKIVKANHPMNSLGNFAKRNREQGDVLNVALAGILSGAKGLNMLEEMLTLTKGMPVSFSIFGFSFFVDKAKLDSIMRANQNVSIVYNLSDLEFQQRMAQQDILFNYRSEYRGEASRATLEALRLGVVPLVRNIGWYAELPDSVSFKAESEQDAVKMVVNLASDLSKTNGQLSEKKRSIDTILNENFSTEEYVKKVLE